METKLSSLIIEAATEVHDHLGGPGLLESIYEAALCYELSLRGIHTQRQLPIPVTYKNIPVRDPLFLDILVESKIIIEVKATGRDFPFYQAQLLSHLRLSNLPYGMLINFGKTNIKEGICPLVNPMAIRTVQVSL
jgi:GxxExxY protein